MAVTHAPRAFYGRIEHSSVVALKGQVRYMTVRALRDFVDALVAQDDNDTLIIDLRELESIDSTGMGLLARLGRSTLQHGRRSVIVCAVQDVMTCLLSAAFDSLFIIVDRWPFDEETDLAEVSLEAKDQQPDIMGRFILDAHRDLASICEKNQRTFAGVISALEADLANKGVASCD